MPQITGYVPGPYDGVSQVDATIRLAGACTEMEDCYGTLPAGLQRRPPLQYITKLTNPALAPLGLSDAYTFVHFVDRGDPAEDLALVLRREGLSVKAYLYKIAQWVAQPLTVDGFSTQPYLDYDAVNCRPTTDFKAVTVEDTTFVTNRRFPVVNDPGNLWTPRPYEALLWVKTGGYARTTTVSVTSAAIPGTYTATFSTNDGSTAADANALGTARLAQALYDGTDPAPGNDTPNTSPLNALAGFGFTVTLDGSIIYLSHDTVDFTLTVTDDAGGSAVAGIKGSVQRFSDLPALAHEGFTVRVAQAAAGANNDYYLEFVPAGSSSTGYWKEVLAPSAPLGVDTTTLPMQLIFDEVLGWELVPGSWTNRTVGDADLSPDPAFIGDTIQDVNWHKGRLGLLASRSYDLSTSNSPWQHYATTLAAALDSDPIQLPPPGNGRRRFKQLATFDDLVVTFGNKLQGKVVSEGGRATPSTTACDVLSTSEFWDPIPVQTCVSKLYFAASARGSLSFYELRTDRVSGQQVPLAVSAGVPSYIPVGYDRAVTYETDFVTIYGASGLSRMVVHAYRHDDKDERVQNAWFAWNLPTNYTLVGLTIQGSIAYLLLNAPNGQTVACSLDLSPDSTDEGGSILTYLDVRSQENEQPSPGVYDPGRNETDFPTLLAANNGLRCSVRGVTGWGEYPEGYTPDVVTTGDPARLTVKGDWTSAPLWFGLPYDSFFEPTTIYKRGTDGNPELQGRLTLQRLKLNVSPGSYVRAEVTVHGRPTKVPFEGVPAGDLDTSPEGQRVAVIAVPVSGRNEETVLRFSSGNSVLGFRVLGFEWQGSWNPKASRVP